MKTNKILALLLFMLIGTVLHAESATTAREDLSKGFPSILWGMVAIIIILMFVIVALMRVLRNLYESEAVAEKFKEKYNKNTVVPFLLFAMLIPSLTEAAEPSNIFYQYSLLSNYSFYLLAVVILIELIVLFQILSKIKSTLNILSGMEEKEDNIISSVLNINLAEAVPVEKEHEIMFDHEYDGIRELDNNLSSFSI